MKSIVLLVVCMLLNLSGGEAAVLAAYERPTVAVMDFGKHIGAASTDIVLDNTEKTSSDYIIEALVENGRYDVVDKDLLAEKLAEQSLNTTGIIDPDTARRIGEILGVRYIIYGNLNDVTGSSTGVDIYYAGANVHTVKAHIIARMMDVNTGDIVMAAKGEGSSKSSIVKAGEAKVGYITIGTAQISQISVHNSIKKAAYAMVDKLTERLFGTAGANAYK